LLRDSRDWDNKVQIAAENGQYFMESGFWLKCLFPLILLRQKRFRETQINGFQQKKLQAEITGELQWQ
jgi:hypothetical protein